MMGDFANTVLSLLCIISSVLFLLFAWLLKTTPVNREPEIKVGQKGYLDLRGPHGVIHGTSLANDRVRGGMRHGHTLFVTVVVTNKDFDILEAAGGLSIIRSLLIDGATAPGLQVINRMSRANTRTVLESGGIIDYWGRFWYKDLR